MSLQILKNAGGYSRRTLMGVTIAVAAVLMVMIVTFPAWFGPEDRNPAVTGDQPAQVPIPMERDRGSENTGFNLNESK